MKAEEAKKISKAAKSRESLNKHLAPIYNQIKNAAEAGRDSITINGRLHREVTILYALKNILHEDGYRVMEESDQRDNASWTTISW